MKKYFLCSLLFFNSSLIFGQPIYTKKEIGFKSDDDSYILPFTDRYYTNGSFLSFKYLLDTAIKNLNKKIIEFQIGQQIYTPYQSNVPLKSQQDRPFAGYLFVQTTISKFYQNGSVLKLSAQLGILGPSALGEQVQTLWHQLIHYYKPLGWEYQIGNSLGMQADFLGSKKILPSILSNHVDANLVTSIQTGSIWDDISVGILERASIIKLLPLYNSNMFGASIGVNTRNEAFLYFFPELNYTFYDASIEGSIFKKNSPLVFGIIPFRFEMKAGVHFRFGKINVGYDASFLTRELQNKATKPDKFGSLSISLLY